MIYKLLFMFCFIVASIQGQRDTANVTLQVYYETYDIYSRLFIVTELMQVVELFGSESFAVEMYAYGFAKTYMDDGEPKFLCEHRDQECLGNKFDACAVDMLDIQTALGLIYCIIDPYNRLRGEYIPTTYTECMFQRGVNTTVIHDCSVSERGTELLMKNQRATDLVYLDPEKDLPYVLINGQEWSTDDNVSLFVSVCEAFAKTGSIIPPYCF